MGCGLLLLLAAPPAGRAGIQVSGAVGGVIGRTSEAFRMLGFNFDFWPSTKAKWGTCGVLSSALTDPLLLDLAARLNGSMLRIGGSPADFMVYDVFQGACSAANLNSTQPTLGPDGKPHGYFCPIWDQVAGQCLTMDRWAQVWGRQPLLLPPPSASPRAAVWPVITYLVQCSVFWARNDHGHETEKRPRQINAFARSAGLHIAFDLNGCCEHASAGSAQKPKRASASR
eukprot:COSAG01_NODE_903_length_12848_cov_7.966899_13_plen_228_part_00